MMKKFIKYFFGGLAILAVIIFLLGGTFLVWIQTGHGQKFIEKTINKYAVWQDGLLVVEGLSGRIPFDIEIRKIHIQDVRGEWLTVEHARLKWSFRELLKLNFHIHELGADSVFFKRLLEPKPRHKEKEKTPSEDIQWSWPLPSLTVEKLYLHKAHLAGDVLGEEAGFSLEGRLHANRQGFSLAGLHLVRLDKSETRLLLYACLTKDPDHLDVDIELYDSATLSSWIDYPGFPGIISLDIKGSAPLDSWQGRLELKGLEQFWAAIDLNIDRRNKNLLSAQGEFFINPTLIPEPLSVYAHEPFALLMNLELEPNKIIRLDELLLSSPALDLAGQASINPDDLKINGRVQLSVQDISRLIGRADLVSHDPAQVEATFEGPVTAMKTEAVVTLGKVAGHGFSVGGTKLDALALVGDLNKDYLVMTSGSLSLTGLDYVHYPGLPAEYLLDFDLSYLRNNKLLIDKFDLRSKDSKSGISGELDLETLTFSSRIDLFLKDFGQFIPLDPAKFEFSGDLTLSAEAKGSIKKNFYTLEAQTFLQDFSTRDEIINILAGQSPTLKLSLEMGDDMVLLIHDLSLSTPEIKFNGQGSMAIEKDLLDFQAQIRLADLSDLASALDQDLKGEVLISAGIKGKPLNPQIEMKGLVNHFRINDLDPMDIRAKLSSAYSGKLLSGNVDMNIIQADLRLDIYTDFSLRGKNLGLTNLSSRGLGLSVTANLAMDLETMLADGTVRAGSSDLGELGRFLNLELQGRGETHLALTRAQEGQNIAFSLKANDIITELLSVALLESSGEVKNIHTLGLINAHVSISGVSAPNVNLKSLEAQVTGRGKEFDFKTRLSGHVQENLELLLAGDYSYGSEAHVINISALEGTFADKGFRLKSSFSFSYSPTLWDLTPVEVALGSGLLRLRARMNPGDIDGRLNLTSLPLSEIPVPGLERIEGLLSLDFQIRGDPNKPVAVGDIRIDDLVSAFEVMQAYRPMNMNAALRLEQGLAVIDGTIREDNLTLAEVHLKVPIRISVMPVDLSIPDPVPMDGNVNSMIRLEKIASMFLTPNQIVSGIMSADLKISGTHANPLLEGRIQVNQTSYQNLEAGLYLADIKILLKTTEKRIEIEEFSATDGKAGRLTGAGFLIPDFDKKLPWSFELKIQDAEVLRHELAQVSVSEGAINITGNTDGASAAGVITFGRIEASLPDKAPPEIAELEVTEINREAPKDAPKPEKSKTDSYPVDLNIELRFPAGVYVRGYGLDSEWSGNLNIKGSAQKPGLRGNLKVVRGRLVFLDRRFDLKDSFIFLDGSYPPDPTVDITASYRQKDKDITVKVLGPALKPELSLSSNPPMHQDEILAWVLFGRDLSTVTPFQAISLANAARALATGDTGPGIMDRIRSITGIMDRIRSMAGVDDIDISKDPEKGHTEFGVGKYVHEKVYVQVKKGTASGTESVSMEVELTPKVRLESSYERDGAGGVGLFWKHDY
ncbi:MAG: translocation/assembly module TamB domain-containing protein [Deltaproteobacteria bacterium]|nr:translocation/assembly module TamB domain-containing protein [Deltaproteobacteria bacterium]